MARVFVAVWWLQYFDMDSGGAAVKQLEGYAREGVLRLHDWAAVPGVKGYARPWHGPGGTDRNFDPTWKRIGWDPIFSWQQGQTLTRQVCYWSLRRRAKYMLINDIDELLVLWRPPHTFQQTLMPWAERVHSESGGAIRGFSLLNIITPPNLVGVPWTTANSSEAEQMAEESVLGSVRYQKISYAPERFGKNGLRFHRGRWKYILRLAEEDGRAILPPVWYHSIFHSSFHKDMTDLLDRMMVLVPETDGHLRHLVPFPRLSDKDDVFPDRGYSLKLLPEPLVAAMTAAIRGGPVWLAESYAHSPSSLNASELSRAGKGDGALPETCVTGARHNYTYLCA